MKSERKVSFTQFFFSTHAFSTTHLFFINQVEGIRCLWRAKWIALKRIWRKQPVWMLFSPAGAVSLALATKWEWYTLEKKALFCELYSKSYHIQKWPLLTHISSVSLTGSQVPSSWYSVVAWDIFLLLDSFYYKK